MMFGVRSKAHFHLAVVFVCIMKVTTIYGTNPKKPGLNESDSKYTKFQCTFENKKYRLATDKPIWSSEDTPKELIFVDMAEWLKFKEKIEEAFADVMKRGYALNNLDHFIRFISAFKNRNDIQKNLEPFFDDYHVPELLEDPVSLLVDINQRLEEIYPRAKNLMYMASAYVNPHKDFVDDVIKSHDNIKDYAEKNAENELTQSRFQRHIAGIIKIQLNNTKGIVILDPGYFDLRGYKHGFPNALFMLKKNNDYAYGYKFGRLYGEMGVLDTVLAHKFGLVIFQTPYTNYYDPRILYLHNKPFCSFMDNTIKRNLLAPYFHAILTFDQNGSPKGYFDLEVRKSIKAFTLTTSIIDKYTSPLPYFNIGPALKQNITNRTYFSLVFINASNMTKWAEDFMKNATEYMGNNFLSKLDTIKSEVLTYGYLVSKIYNLNNKLIDAEEKPSSRKNTK